MSQPPPPPLPPFEPQPVQALEYSAAAPRTNGLAIASLVVSIIGLIIPLGGVLGIIFGVVGLKKVREQGAGGRGLAMAGVIVGCFTTLTTIVGIAIMVPALNRARINAREIKCMANMRTVGQAVMMYAADNKGYYPPDINLLISGKYLPSSVLLCPTVHPPGTVPAAPTTDFVYAVTGQSVRASRPPGGASRFVLLYEPLSNHSDGEINALFGDGHVERIKNPRSSQFIKSLEAGNNPPK